ncbi:hypothetical protein HOM50_01270 [bacterium]|jgi:hypothetical protein|nr:hypothetical protein [bacterium]MBT5015021.1 hypothetical protein [bacterium]
MRKIVLYSLLIGGLGQTILALDSSWDRPIFDSEEFSDRRLSPSNVAIITTRLRWLRLLSRVRELQQERR